MDDITVVVAQVKTVAVPEDEVDPQDHSILVQKQRCFIFSIMQICAISGW
jgi:hypothetical protein